MEPFVALKSYCESKTFSHSQSLLIFSNVWQSVSNWKSLAFACTFICVQERFKVHGQSIWRRGNRSRESIYRFQLIRFNFSFSLLSSYAAHKNTIQRLIQYFTSIMSWHKQPRKHINFEIFFSFFEAEYLMEDFVSYPVLNLPPSLCIIIITTHQHERSYRTSSNVEGEGIIKREH